MEQFHDGQHVWLRSRAVDQYLRADDDDGSGVSLHQDRASMHAAWAVHILHVPGGAGDILMLHSAANGRYLAATATGWAGNGVTLRDLDQLPSRTVGWFAVRSEFAGDDVLLRHTSGRFLRVDDRNLWWNNIGVSVDVFNGRRPYMRQWVVEAIPPRESIPRLPIPTPRAFFSVRIWYVRASPLGIFLPTAWRPLSFNGRSVFYLRNRLASQLGIREASDVIMCVQAGCFGRLTPLVTDLPSNNVPNKIVVLTAGTIAANRLSHPNVLHAA